MRASCAFGSAATVDSHEDTFPSDSVPSLDTGADARFNEARLWVRCFSSSDDSTKSVGLDGAEPIISWSRWKRKRSSKFSSVPKLYLYRAYLAVPQQYHAVQIRGVWLIGRGASRNSAQQSHNLRSCTFEDISSPPYDMDIGSDCPRVEL